MNIRQITLGPVILAGLLVPGLSFGQQAQPAEQTPVIKSTVDEVILDVVVRDKKGKPIKDLTAADFQIEDNGVKQKVNSCRLVEGKEAISQGAHVPLDPLRQVRLVTLVFERLDIEPRRRAKLAALDLLKGDQGTNVFYSVLTIDSRLYALQPFTNDRELLKKAVDKATGGQYNIYAGESTQVKAKLQQILANPVIAPPTSATPNATATGEGFGAAAMEQKLAQVMTDMLSFDASMSTSENTRTSIFALLSLARGQYSLPGRKSILYFSEGMWLPPSLDEPFRSIASTANRGNVTIYAVDTRGVQGSGNVGNIAQEMSNISADTSADITSRDGRVSMGQIMAADRVENAMRSNVQAPLAEMSEGTGGFLIGDTNDLRTALRKVNEEVNSYYEVYYSPGIASYDGSFRKTHVDVARKDTVVHARSGYFALPMDVRGPIMMPFELPLMKAITANPLPKDVEFRASAIRFQPGKDGVKASLMVEVPMAGVTFTEVKENSTFKSRVSLVSLLKDDKGEVVKKLSYDLPRSGQLALLPQARGGNFIYKEQLTVPPGRYTVETAVMDHEAGKVGVKKSAFVVQPKPSGVNISSVSVVRGYAPNAKDLDAADPFQFQGGRITPTLSGTVYAVKGAMLSVFFVVYPDPAIAEKPQVTLQFLVGGNVVGSGELQLPAADALGRIPYVMSSSAESMPPGEYQIKAIAKQGSTTAEETAFVTVAERK
jgi:VWFA-related protein